MIDRVEPAILARTGHHLANASRSAIGAFRGLMTLDGSVRPLDAATGSLFPAGTARAAATVADAPRRGDIAGRSLGAAAGGPR